MTIATYISDLLYRYECVILPGFGAILTNRKPAEIIKGTRTFNPPTKTLSFNRQLTQNDGLLANYIAESEDVSYDTAFDKLQQYLHFIESEIEEGKKVEIENVGFFHLSSEEKILFEPNEKVNYLTEAFGLNSYTSAAITRTMDKPAEAPVLTNSSRNSPLLKYAAVGIIAIGLAGFAGFQLYNIQVNEHNIAEQQKAATKLEQEIQHATFLIENPLPTVNISLATKPKGDFHIVAGAFRVEENAEKKVEELKALGYKARGIGANKYGLHQVIYGSYQTRSEALVQLKQIQQNLNSGAWLLVEEL